MNDQQTWDRLKSLFDEALQVPEAERDAYLTQKSEGNAALLAELRSLIAAAKEPANLLEKNIIDLPKKLDTAQPEYTDLLFGKYRVLREIGSGGMGSVFLARRDDGEFSMDVALKIVKQSLADSAIIARFRQERQILARLNHANIAVLHDGGISDKGEPYLAMEYVEGETLTEHCHRHRLTVRERLALFLKICAAVSYAHRNLVVHRDIKPSNILVTTDGEPKLLDFGLAKIVEGSPVETQTAFRAFTPAYASPEQILGEPVSTASDQYSLGVLLFELLSGTKPFEYEGKSLDAIVRLIGTTEAPTLSTALRSSHQNAGEELDPPKISRDLEKITAKALRREPERRYPSVEALADDIERHLAGLPVSARPPTFAYLASRFVRRNRTAVIAAAAILVVILAGLGFSIWQATVARAERDRAENRFQEVRQLSNSLLFEIAPKIERLEGSTEARELLVIKALAYLDNLAAESRDDMQLQAELAQAYQKVGDLQGNPTRPNLSDFVGALSSYEKSRTILEALPETPETRAKLAATLRAMALIRFAQNEIRGSLADSEAALALFRSLRADAPDRADIAKEQLAAEIEYAHTFAINNEYELAVPVYRRALAELAGMDNADREVRRLSALGTAYLSNGLSWNGQQEEAEAENARAVAFADDIRVAFPNDSGIQRTVFDVYLLASSTFETIKNDVSLMFAEKALSVARRSAEIDTADTQARQNLGKAVSRYGIVLNLVGRLGEGSRHLRDAENIFLALIAREPRNKVYQDDLGTLYTRLGDSEKSRGNLAASLAAYQRAADVYQKLAEGDDRNLVARRDWAQAVKSVAVMQIKLARTDEAKKNLVLAIEMISDLKARNALGKWDARIFDEMPALLEKLHLAK